MADRFGPRLAAMAARATEAYRPDAGPRLAAMAARLTEAYRPDAVRLQCNPAPMLAALLIFALTAGTGIQVATHLAQVIEALRIGGAIVCCVAGTAILALTLWHVNQSAKASAGLRNAFAGQHHQDVPPVPVPDPLGDAALSAPGDPSNEAALTSARGGTDADEIEAHADRLASDRVLLLGGADGSVLEREQS